VSANDRWLTAVHEAGHALVAKLTEGSNPVQKVTIVPHSMQGGSAGGVTVTRPREGDHVTVQHLSAQLDVCMVTLTLALALALTLALALALTLALALALTLTLTLILTLTLGRPRGRGALRRARGRERRRGDGLQRGAAAGGLSCSCTHNHLHSPVQPPFNPGAALTFPVSLTTASYRPYRS